MNKKYKSSRSGRIYLFEGYIENYEFFKVISGPKDDPCLNKSVDWLQGSMSHLELVD